jgi:hypothetical protein
MTGEPILARSLNRLKILATRRPLLLKFFEAFIESRCIPIDSEGNTKSGCIALDLEFVAGDPQNVFKEIRDSRLWKVADIMENGHKMRFHWKYDKKP